MCLLASWISSFEKNSFQFICPLLSWVIDSLEFSFEQPGYSSYKACTLVQVFMTLNHNKKMLRKSRVPVAHACDPCRTLRLGDHC
jgi:hypothetical protein